MSASILQLYKTISRKPFGHWLFSRAVCFKAPYFGSIKPRMIVLQPNRAEATIKHIWAPCMRLRFAIWQNSPAAC